MGLPTNHRRVRVLAAALSAIVLASALSACGGGTEFTPNERSRAKGSTLAEAGVPEAWDLVTAPPAASNLHSVEIAGTTMTVDDEGGVSSYLSPVAESGGYAGLLSGGDRSSGRVAGLVADDVNGQTFDLTLDDCVTGLTVAAPDDGGGRRDHDARRRRGGRRRCRTRGVAGHRGLDRCSLVAGNERYLAGVTRIGGAEAGQPPDQPRRGMDPERSVTGWWADVVRVRRARDRCFGCSGRFFDKMSIVTASTAPLSSSAMIDQLGLADSVVDEQVLANSVARFREQGITLPTFAQLADPSTIDPGLTAGVDKERPTPATCSGPLVQRSGGQPGRGARPRRAAQGADRGRFADHRRVRRSLPDDHRPQVLAAYSCLAPRVICGQFDPTVHRAVWPSTGNYARGGIAISRIMACRGVAILPEGMSQERFDWLDRWCANPAEDVIKTVGTESNVKEIYDACNALAKDPGNFILNQFAELGNHLGHYEVTGRALGHVFEHVAASHPGLRLAAFTSATGSAGTIAAGDRLKDDYGTKIVAVEALECPTMLENGFGEHNIQGIGDKHIPLIQNVMNTDVVVGISDKATDELDVLYNSPAGQAFLADRKGVSPDIVAALEHFGFSSTCNVLAAIKTAKLLGLGADDAIITVATDGGAMYPSERAKTLDRRFGGSFDASDAAEVFGEHLAHVDTSDMIECTEKDRTRIFNLGYYTWVEQQGTPFDLFTARRSQDFWRSLRRYLGVWDELIEDFNARVAANG
ncbi:MAG: hypothetical protein R2705_08720 [Ilumatobacteraceae bacterium]